MRKLSHFENNKFTPKLYDLILPNNVLSEPLQKKDLSEMSYSYQKNGDPKSSLNIISNK